VLVSLCLYRLSCVSLGCCQVCARSGSCIYLAYTIALKKIELSLVVVYALLYICLKRVDASWWVYAFRLIVTLCNINL
jgi:hypothetical protein